LQLLVPKGNEAILVSQEEQQKNFSGDSGRDEPRRRTGASGITYVSRPGFNAKRTEAVMQINHVADAEMGIGYRVYLKKSSKSGEWTMVDSVLNRRY
jgi:hypothetical protein